MNADMFDDIEEFLKFAAVTVGGLVILIGIRARIALYLTPQSADWTSGNEGIGPAILVAAVEMSCLVFAFVTSGFAADFFAKDTNASDGPVYTKWSGVVVALVLGAWIGVYTTARYSYPSPYWIF